MALISLRNKFISKVIFLAVALVVAALSLGKCSGEKGVSNESIVSFVKQNPIIEKIPFLPTQVKIVESKVNSMGDKQVVTLSLVYVFTRDQLEEFRQKEMRKSDVEQMKTGFILRNFLSKGEKISKDELRVVLSRTITFIKPDGSEQWEYLS